MLILRFVVLAFSGVTMMLGTGVVGGQSFPSKPIRIVNGVAGAGNDFMSRLIAQGITGPLGQPVIVDNRAGDHPIDIVSKAPPDGHSLLFEGGSFWIVPLLRKTFYDPVKDFSPVVTVSKEVSILVVTPSLPVSNVKELIALAKAKPGELNYSSSTAGSGSHLAGEYFKSMAGVNIVWVPYKGSPQAATALIAGETQVMISSSDSVGPHVKAGRVKALAVASLQPSPLAPGLPTVADTLPGFELTSASGIFAPANTPAPIITRLNQEIVRYLRLPETKEKFLAAGLETVGSSPEGLAAEVKGQMTRLGKVVKDAGIRTD